ncbi:MAG: hypothetical protein U9Q74_01550 [Gemmatimonadota bacterium]|nr:hypothetical protein [Gemmatimonadota bacterium]
MTSLRRPVAAGIGVAAAALGAWALAGALGQWARASSVLQEVQTVAQVAFGASSLLLARDLMRWVRPRTSLRTAWEGAFVVTTVLSTLAWGPAMLVPTIVVAALTLAAVAGVRRALPVELRAAGTAPGGPGGAVLPGAPAPPVLGSDRGDRPAGVPPVRETAERRPPHS